MVSPRTFGFLGFFGISAVLSIFFLDWFFVFWIFWNFCSFEPFFQSPNKTKVLIGFCHSSVYLDPLGGGGFSARLLDFSDFRNFRSSELFFLIAFLFSGFFGFSAASSRLF